MRVQLDDSLVIPAVFIFTLKKPPPKSIEIRSQYPCRFAIRLRPLGRVHNLLRHRFHQSASLSQWIFPRLPHTAAHAPGEFDNKNGVFSCVCVCALRVQSFEEVESVCKYDISRKYLCYFIISFIYKKPIDRKHHTDFQNLLQTNNLSSPIRLQIPQKIKLLLMVQKSINHPFSMKPDEKWEIFHINCRISEPTINSSTV